MRYVFSDGGVYAWSDTLRLYTRLTPRGAREAMSRRDWAARLTLWSVLLAIGLASLPVTIV